MATLTDLVLSEVATRLRARAGAKRAADCASMEVVGRLRLDGAFTFDADFRDCGVRSLP